MLFGLTTLAGGANRRDLTAEQEERGNARAENQHLGGRVDGLRRWRSPAEAAAAGFEGDDGKLVPAHNHHNWDRAAVTAAKALKRVVDAEDAEAR